MRAAVHGLTRRSRDCTSI